MHVSHYHMAVPLAVLATLALLLAAIAPVLAAPSGTSGSRAVLASHVDPADCEDITTNVDGDIIVDGTALTAAQLALLDADLTAALLLAANASASADATVDVCVDVVAGTGDLLDINADISVCSVDVTVNGDGTVDLGDVNVDADLLDARLIAALQLAADAAADADTEACVVVTVTDNAVDADVEVNAIVTLCATLIVDANGDFTINGDFIDADQFINNSSESDFNAEVEVGVEITSTVEADGDIFVLVTAFDLAGCGDIAGATPTPTPTPAPAATGMVMVMKHLCDASIQSEADFVEVEERAATNPTTPMGIPTLGSTAETVLACPVIVQTGDGQTPGAIGSGSRSFDFTVVDSQGTTQVLTADSTFSGDNGFDTPVEDFACESTINYDADRDGTIEDDVCLDFSAYAFADVVEGAVTVDEIEAPPSTRFGTVRLTPPEISDDAAVGLDFSSDGVITFDSSADEDDMVTLHVYNFVNVAAASPTPVASVLPDAAVDGGQNDTNPMAPILALLAMTSLGVIGYRTVAARRAR